MKHLSNSLIKGMSKTTSKGLTENGAVTFTKSESYLLDFFAQAGATRENLDRAIKLFSNAYSEDKITALRILFYLRDVRGGQGERDVFRVCLEWLSDNDLKMFENVVKHVPEYGRWDDLFFDSKACNDLIREQIIKDHKSETPSLLAKWLPTANASSFNTREKAKMMADRIGLGIIGYRKIVRDIRKKLKIVEEKMSANKWSEIDYSKVPSQASIKHRNAFYKHDEERYTEFVERVTEGKEKINASTLYPYQVYEQVKSNYNKALEALWVNLPDYTRGKNAIVVADTSGSMYGRPMSVSVSLALYFAERNQGQFKDCFISFSEKPKIHNIVGSTLKQKMYSIELGDVANTNLQAVFDLILDTAVEYEVPKEEMPETIYIISDMEFDEAQGGGWGDKAPETNYEAIKRKYKKAGYKKPNIVFWNVDSRNDNMPAFGDEEGVSLVSGFSPSIFKSAVENKTPMEVMLDTVNSERYSVIC